MFKKIFSNLFSCINKKPKKFLCSINFEITQSNTIDISYHWPNFNDSNKDQITKVATELATLIHLLNSGFLKQDILKTFNQRTDNSNSYDETFINVCLASWLDLIDYDKSLNDNTPIIKPSLVFKPK